MMPSRGGLFYTMAKKYITDKNGTIINTFEPGDRILKTKSLDYIKHKQSFQDQCFVKLFQNKNISKYITNIKTAGILFLLILHCDYKNGATHTNGKPITKDYICNQLKITKWTLNKHLRGIKNIVSYKQKIFTFNPNFIKKGK